MTLPRTCRSATGQLLAVHLETSVYIATAVTSGAVHRTVARGDVALALVEAGDRSAPTIVLVHGYPDTKEVWAPVVDRLAAEFHVVAYDVRGAGGSTAPRGPAAYRLDLLQQDFVAVCDAVAPGRSVHLVGHDWGGVQGWEFVSSAGLEHRIASFTTIAGPALGHALAATRTSFRRAVRRALRSWYIVAILLPGGPTVMWRVVLSRGRWRAMLRTREGLALADEFPAATVTGDGLHGANLYRRNIPPRLLRRSCRGPARAPVQLIIPSGDRFISEAYYDAASAPRLVRRTIDGSHWAQRAHPDLVARWIGEFVRDAEERRA